MSEPTEALATTAMVQHYTEVLMLPFRVTDMPFSVDTTSLHAMCAAFEPSLVAAGWTLMPAADIPAFAPFDAKSAANAARTDAATGSNWDRLQHYQAFSYFHPTVRNFLFGSMSSATRAGDPTNDYLRVFRRHDVAQMCVAVDVYDGGGWGEQVCSFDVVRCDLALMQPDVGVLQLELRARIGLGESWSVKVMQQVRDRIRRLYPPYFNEARGGHFPNWVRFSSAVATSAPLYDGEHVTKAQPLPQRYVDDTLGTAPGTSPLDAETSPCAGHWGYLLTPLVANNANLRLILPGDDRLPSMAFVAVDQPRAISRGDWVRLTYANEAGGDALPYSRNFLRDFEARHCYDRFWHDQRDATDSPSRIMNCGYAFTMVGSFGNQDFFMNAQNGALVAFRQIYVRMGLVAHFQKTALLGATARLSALSWRNSEGGDLLPYERADRAEQIMNLYRHFIEFTHVFWFDEVSPQEQGIEMFAMWQRELRSKELYTEVRQELKDLVEYVGAERAKAQQQTAQRLTRMAAWLGGLGVFAGLLGMNILPFKDGEFSDAAFTKLVSEWPLVGGVQKLITSADWFWHPGPIQAAINVTAILTILVGIISYFPIDALKLAFGKVRRLVSRRNSPKKP